MVTAVEPGRIKVGDEWIATDVTLWATGVAASPLGKELRCENRPGRTGVDRPGPERPRTSRALCYRRYVRCYRGERQTGAGSGSGRNSAGKNRRGEYPARLARRNTSAVQISTTGELWRQSDYHRAVAEFGNKKFSGVIAWLLWSVVHVFLLIGFRSRVTVMTQWVWAYLTRRGSSPLITEYRRAESGTKQ